MEETLAPKLGLDLDNPRGKATLAAMAAFEGVPRLRSTHVGGFVLSCAPLGDYMPVEHTTMGRTIIQFDKDDLDYINVPKFDFLGLGGLTMIRLAFDAIEARTGTRPDLVRRSGRDRPSAAQAEHRLRVPDAGAFPAHVGRRQHRIRAVGQEGEEGRDRCPGR